MNNPAKIQPSWVGKTRILIVDDNQDVVDMFAAMLQMLGYETHVALSGTEALEQVKKCQPHAIFLEIALPDMDGHQVANTTRKEHASVPPMVMIALSGFAADTDAATSSVFDRYLLKPVGFDEIYVLLNDLAKNHEFIAYPRM